MLKDFYKKWYTPGNAILVIVGDVDPAATIAKVKQLYGDIPNHPAARAPGHQPYPGQAGDLHPRQQSALRSGLHRLSHAGHRFARLCGDPNPGGHPGQPACRCLRHGARGQSPLCRASALPKAIPKPAWVSARSLCLPAPMPPAPSTRCARSSRAMRKRACPRTCSTLPSAARLPPPSFSATPSPGWLRCGRKLLPPKAATLPTTTSRPSGRSPWPT